MSCAAAVQNDTIWLESKNYDIVPLNSRVASHVSELTSALRQGVPAYPDNAREGFYDIELESGWSYIHVHENAQTVYLIAHSGN